MEVRGVCKVWGQAMASRSRRFVVCLAIVSLVFALTILSNETSTGGVLVEGGEQPHLTTLLQQVDPGPDDTPKHDPDTSSHNPPDTHSTSELVKPPQVTDKAKGQILKNLYELDVRQLQQVQRYLDSKSDPQAVDQFRIGQALQTLKVQLLEEISGRKFPDILDAATQAQAISSQPRPGPRQMLFQVVISTTWRSGSTFLEELLASHPAVYNHYEPLMQFGLRQIREGKDSETAQELIHDLLSCKYKAKSEYMKTAFHIKEMMSRNTPVWQTCSSKQSGEALCYNDQFLQGACQLFPWSTMKIVRLRLRLLRPILEDSKLNARVVYLVRDPRGVINSRSDTVKWCNKPDCNDPALLCQDMDDDLTAALEFRDDFPGQVFVLRYEDMSLSPHNKTQELLDFLGLDFDPKMKEFLASHTTKNYDKPWSTSRDSKTRVTYWASKIKPEKLKQVQDNCEPVMKRFGYLPVESTNEVSIEKVLAPLNATDIDAKNT